MRLVRYAYPTPRSLASLGGVPSPWSGLENEIDRLFSTVLNDSSAPSAERFPVDLYEDKDSLFVRAELPGIERSDINVEVVENYLNLTAAHKEAGNEESFSFSRSVAIPESVQGDKVSAQYQDGVLTVTLPKKEEAKPRKIAVSVN